MELCEELLQGLPADIGEDIEPPPVRHPHHNALHAELSGPDMNIMSVGITIIITDLSITCFMQGISISTPSSPNLFSPGHFFARKFSNPMDLYCLVRKKIVLV